MEDPAPVSTPEPAALVADPTEVKKERFEVEVKKEATTDATTDAAAEEKEAAESKEEADDVVPAAHVSPSKAGQAKKTTESASKATEEKSAPVAI
jgi:hypothetical protein